MEIKLNDTFYLKQSCETSPWMWDLVKRVVRTKKDGKTQWNADVTIAFGMDLPTLAGKIADFQIFKEDSEEMETFETYIENYKKLNEKISEDFRKGLKELIKNINK